MQRNSLPQECKDLRKALYPPGSLEIPSLSEKKAVFEKIVAAFPGLRYTQHQHLTWCSGKDQEIRKQWKVTGFVETQLAGNPNPTLRVMQEWAAAVGVGFTQLAITVEKVLSRTPVPDRGCGSLSC
ncbi:hypothetical protein OH77DRAFT_1429044 [Trametes cingulata]|nr:hypothetical protein OH77DRAFT_1429044 [Trametes cingulata]